MRTRAVFATSLLALTFAVASASTAEAQCRPGWFCANLQVGVGIGVGVYGQPPPPPPPPTPPVVIVQPAPQQLPPPPIVYVQPQPPPVVYVQQRPVYYQPQQPTYVQTTTRRRYWLDFGGRYGMRIATGFMLTDTIAMGGGSVAFRWRGDPHVALDISLGTYGGTDHDGRERLEVPLVADLIFYANPDDRVQFYGLIGVGLDYAAQGGAGFSSPGREFTHVGGEIGVGLEFRLGRHFALNLDVRGFIRQNLADGGAEFSNGTQTTNTSGGVYPTFGATFYF